jgi:hypothetical protein
MPTERVKRQEAETRAMLLKAEITAEAERLRARIGELEKELKAAHQSKQKPKAANGTVSRITEDNDLPPEKDWQWSLSILAEDIISLSARWTDTFGDWRKFEVPSDLLKLATKAVVVLSQIVSKQLVTQVKLNAASPADDGIPDPLRREPPTTSHA